MKYFVVSDIHSFYTELKTGLRTAGFNKKNKDHTLIVCGDVFDRGDESVEVYKYLASIPKKRCILIRGNHESLYFDLLKKQFPDDYDYSNGTVHTFCAIAGIDEERLSKHYYFKIGRPERYRDQISATWKEIIRKVKESEITAWLESAQWKDYYELGRFIFVHSFIPVINKDGLPGYYTRNRNFEYMPDWRENAKDYDWEDARWGCPYKQYKDGLFKVEEEHMFKTLVCGHWHTKDFHRYLGGSFDPSNDIYYSTGIIALDGGVEIAYDDNFGRGKHFVHPQNVLVIDNNKCYDKNSNELKDMSKKTVEIKKDLSKTEDYFVAAEDGYYDITLCAAEDCKAPCCRRAKPREKYCTVGCFQENCQSYIKE